jgi:hypothetical protein
MWCKRLWRVPQVAWLSARFLRFISLTLALSHWPLLVLCRCWSEAWRTHDSWTPIAHVTWPESLNGSPTSLTWFSCVWFLCEFGLWLFLVVDSFGGLSFSHSMNTPEPKIRFHRFDGFLDSLCCGLGWVRGHASRASFVGPRICSCDAFIGHSHVVPFRDSYHFSNDCTRSFLELIFWHVSKGDSNTSFLNQILHLTNSHDKLTTFV